MTKEEYSNYLKGLDKVQYEKALRSVSYEDGLRFEDALKKYGSWEEVIYSSVRSNPAMDVVTGLYDIYGGN